jgi:hypothetical protein
MHATHSQESSGWLQVEPEAHQLYVLSEAPRPPAQKGRERTLAVLRFVWERLPLLAEMGVRVEVRGFRRAALREPRLVAALKRRGVSALPALVTPRGVYEGRRAIVGVYERNIRVFLSLRDDPRPGRPSAEDALEEFYHSEMAPSRREEEGEDDGDALGEGRGGMMEAYHEMMHRRGPGEGPAPPSAGRRRSGASAPPGGEGAEPRGGGRRADNLEERPFGPAAAELDSGGSAQDDLMEAAYWQNQEMTGV